MESENDDERAKIVRIIRKREELRDAHRKIKFARQKFNTGGTMKLEIVNTNGEKEEITEKTQMEEILMQTYKQKSQPMDLQCARMTTPNHVST